MRYDATLSRLSQQGADSLVATTRLVLTPHATAGYDRGQDAPFISMDDDATALYTRSGGLRYSLNEQPHTTAAVELGMHLAEAGTYTIALSAHGHAGDAPREVWLIDKEENPRPCLLTEPPRRPQDWPTPSPSASLPH